MKQTLTTYVKHSQLLIPEGIPHHEDMREIMLLVTHVNDILVSMNTYYVLNIFHVDEKKFF